MVGRGKTMLDARYSVFDLFHLKHGDSETLSRGRTVVAKCTNKVHD